MKIQLWHVHKSDKVRIRGWGHSIHPKPVMELVVTSVRPDDLLSTLQGPQNNKTWFNSWRGLKRPFQILILTATQNFPLEVLSVGYTQTILLVRKEHFYVHLTLMKTNSTELSRKQGNMWAVKDGMKKDSSGLQPQGSIWIPEGKEIMKIVLKK